MGDERRDFDTPGRTNGHHDQTEPAPPQDETQPFAAPDRTQAGAAGETEPLAASDESRPAAAAPDETQAMAAPDETQPIARPGPDETHGMAAPGPDETQAMAAPDETHGMAAPGPDETQAMAAPDRSRSAAAPDDTQLIAGPDETQPFTPAGEPDHTAAMPQKGVWSGRAGVSPPTGPSLRDSAPYTREIPQAPEPRPWWTPVLLGVLALGLFGILILVAWWMGRDNSPPPVESPSAGVVVPTVPTEPATQPPTTAAASPTAQLVQVPRLVGLDVDDAVAQLDQLGLAYRFEYRQDDAPQGQVIQSSPPEGLVVPVQTTITLVISTGRERSPTPSPTPAVVASATPNN